MPIVEVQVVNEQVVDVIVKPHVVVIGDGGGECDHQKYNGEYEVVT